MDPMLMMMPSSIPSHQIVDVSSSYKTMAVGLVKEWKFRGSIVAFFITLIVAPRSMRLLGTRFLLIHTLTRGTP